MKKQDVGKYWIVRPSVFKVDGDKGVSPQRAWKLTALQDPKNKEKLVAPVLLSQTLNSLNPPLCQEYGQGFRQQTCWGLRAEILAPRRENCTHWLVWDGRLLLFALKRRQIFNQLHVFFLTAQNLHNILQNLEATTDSFNLSQDSLRTWQILTQNLQTPEDKKAGAFFLRWIY